MNSEIHINHIQKYEENPQFTLNNSIESIQLRIIKELSRPINIFVNIYNSNSIIYPFKGILYLINNPSLWPIILKSLPSIILIQAIVIITIFSNFFLVNTTVSMMICGPLGLFISFAITIQESTFLINLILNNYVISNQLISLFDTILCKQDLDSIVYPGKLKRKINITLDDYILEKILWLPYNSTISIYEFIRTLLIYSIPLLGPLIQNLNSFTDKGESSQMRYYKLIRLRSKHISFLKEENEGNYMAFGLIATSLENLPLLGWLFLYTNTIGAALMAVDFHNSN
ncbi:hypothetical protein B5S28_g3268 [[Candida] boidinii]|nr:hypothetical protein B5S28_g3268 [[Candida] boidinii]OWB63321.1 hypothetical protein B5S29_g4293 [[Candida] boidinii]